MANGDPKFGGNSFPAPKGVPQSKGVPKPRQTSVPGHGARSISGDYYPPAPSKPAAKPAKNPVYKPFARGRSQIPTRTVAPKPAPTVFGHGGLGATAAVPTRTVKVAAHTRQVPVKPSAAPTTPATTSTQTTPTRSTASALPATTDKTATASNGVGTGQNVGYFSDQSQVQLQPGQAVGYTPGRGFYARNTPVAAQAQAQAGGGQADPYAAVSLYGNQTPEQLAQAALAPQYTQVDQQTAAEQAALQSFTTAIINQLQGYPSQAPGVYDQAATQMRGDAASVASNIPGATPTYGNAAADALTQEGQAAQTYAGQQPGLQGLAAEQAMRNLLFQASTQRNTIAAQYPGLVSQYATAKSDAAAKQAALQQNAQALGIKTQQQNFTNQVTVKKLGQTDTRLQQGQERLDYQTAAKAAGIKIAASKIDPSVSKVVGYVATANGTPVTSNGKIVPVAATGKTAAAKTPTANEVAKLVQTWHDGKVANVRAAAAQIDPATGLPVKNAQGAIQYERDANGNVVYVSQSASVGKVGYGQAYRRLQAMGVPEKQARQYLNTAYQRGENGRSWVSNTEQAALLKAGLPPKAKVIAGQGVLNAKQTAVLRRTGLLPPGQLTREGFYIIAPGF